MRAQDWGRVKRGHYVIFADQYEGVFKAVVKDIDIKIQDADVPGGYSYPYGMTAESGTVQISMDGALRIVNLADLIKWSGGRYNTLVMMWGLYDAKKTVSDTALTSFNTVVTEYKGAF